MMHLKLGPTTCSQPIKEVMISLENNLTISNSSIFFSSLARISEVKLKSGHQDGSYQTLTRHAGQAEGALHMPERETQPLSS
jgi:hypothetical protein